MVGHRFPAGAYPLDVYQQVLWATELGRRAVGRRVHDQTGPLEPAKELTEGDLRLDARERRPKTDVDAATEPQMGVVRPLRIETVGVSEPRRVPIARSQGQDHHDPPGDRRPRHWISSRVVRLTRNWTGGS